MKTTPFSFGTRLELWAQDQGLNLTQMAEMLGVSKTGVYRYPKDPSLMPKTMLLLKLHEQWPNLNLTWLLTGEGTKELVDKVEEPPEKTSYQRSQGFTQRTQELMDAFNASNEAARGALRGPVQALIADVLHDTEGVLRQVHEGEKGLRMMTDALEEDLL